MATLSLDRTAEIPALFRAVDGLLLDVFRESMRWPRDGGSEVAAEVRRLAVRCGAGLVGATTPGASTSPGVRAVLVSLGELRYGLYLARRLGWVSIRDYRNFNERHEAVVRRVVRYADAVGAPP